MDGKINILLIEKRETIVEMFHTFFDDSHFQIIQHSNLEMFKEVMVNKTPCFIIVDWEMSVARNFMFKEIEASQSISQVPMFFFNVSDQIFNSKRLPNHSNITYLPKSLAKLKLFGKISAAMISKAFSTKDQPSSSSGHYECKLNLEDEMEFESVANSSMLAIFKLNRKGIVCNWNNGAEKIFQYVPTEIIGKSFATIVPKENLYKSKKIINDVIVNKREMHISRIGIRKDKTFVPILFTLSPIIKNDNVTGVYVFGKDISGEKRLTEELKNYRYALDKSGIVSVTDLEGKITYANANFCKVFKFSQEEILGKTHNIIKTDFHDKQFYSELWASISSGKIWKGEMQEKAKNGELFWMDTTVTPFIDEQGKPFKYIVLKNDITKRKYHEEELKKNILMEKSLKMKDEFLANMSHEIRTPLNVILGYSDLLLESSATTNQHKKISTIKKSGKLLLSIINDILDLSKLESGKIVLDNSPFELAKVFEDVRDMLTLEANAKELDFSLEIDPKLPKHVFGDATRTEQILVNVINNAVKFTKVGFVKTSVEVGQKKGDEISIVIKVSDSGIGIPEDKLNTIFESFTQTSRYITRQFGGTGLGLTIVKKLIDQLGGNIEVESELNKGSLFAITLPFKIASIGHLQRESSTVLTPVAQHNYESLDLNILLAEDNEYNQVLAVTRLNSWGCRVEVANNGLEAIEKLRNNNYDLILMDIQMPVMDGYEATKRIRREFDKSKSAIPILALTAHASNGDAIKAKKLGFNDYLFKPFNLPLIYSKLKEFGVNTNEIVPELLQEPNKARDFLSKELVDYSYIVSESLGHKTIIKNLIEAFISEFELFIKSANAAICINDWNAVHKAVHRISPSVSNFNIKSLKNPISNLYKISKSELDTSSYKGILTSVEVDFVAVKAHMKDKLINI